MSAIRQVLLLSAAVMSAINPVVNAAPAQSSPNDPAARVGLDKRDITWPCGVSSQITISEFNDCRPVATGSVVCLYTGVANPGNSCNVGDYCSNFQNFRSGNSFAFKYNDSYDTYDIPTPFGNAKYHVDGDIHCLMAQGDPAKGADGNTCKSSCTEVTESCPRCGGGSAATTVMVCSTLAAAC